LRGELQGTFLQFDSSCIDKRGIYSSFKDLNSFWINRVKNRKILEFINRDLKDIYEFTKRDRTWRENFKACGYAES